MGDIKNVAIRLAGLREAVEISTEEMAKSIGVPTAEYESYENGTADISVSLLRRIAELYHVALPALLFGEEPKMDSYFITRSGCGEKVERSKSYSYQSLAAGFQSKYMHPFMVTVEPSDKEPHMNSHMGQEWNYVIEGCLEINIDGIKSVLNPGDSIMFSSIQPHNMRALNGKRVVFIAVIS